MESKFMNFMGFMLNPLSWVMEMASIMTIALANGGYCRLVKASSRWILSRLYIFTMTFGSLFISAGWSKILWSMVVLMAAIASKMENQDTIDDAIVGILVVEINKKML